MVKNECNKIKDLKERLKCFEEKYKELTLQLEQERDISMISDEPGNYYQILQQRVFILKQMDLVRAKIQKANFQGTAKKRKNRVDVGDRVNLENHEQCLIIQIVREYEADPQTGYISEHSPIGKAVLGKQIGDLVTVALPKGTIEYAIRSIL